MIEKLAEQHPALSEIRPASALLSQLSAKSLEAFEYIRSAKMPPNSWTSESRALLTKAKDQRDASSMMLSGFLGAKQPEGDLVIAPLDGFRALVERAIGTHETNAR